MAKKIKFKQGDYVYSKKQREVGRLTAVREFGGYYKRSNGQGQSLCCPWDDLIEPTKEQKREYIIAQSKAKTVDKKEQISTEFRPFFGGSAKKPHRVKPKAIHIRMIKDILTFLNLKYPENTKYPKVIDRYPISAVWHGIGETNELVLNSKGNGVVSKRKKFVYGWTLVYDWMWLEEDAKFNAYVLAMKKRYEPQGLKFDVVWERHPKVVYAGILCIRPKNKRPLPLASLRND
jgi:hypothetical protein